MICLEIDRGLIPLAPLATSSQTVYLYHKYRRSYGNFNDFTKSRWPYWSYVLEIEKEPGTPSISGYADGHSVQMYVSITSEGVMTILTISWSRGGHIGL